MKFYTRRSAEHVATIEVACELFDVDLPIDFHLRRFNPTSPPPLLHPPALRLTLHFSIEAATAQLLRNAAAAPSKINNAVIASRILTRKKKKVPRDDRESRRARATPALAPRFSTTDAIPAVKQLSMVAARKAVTFLHAYPTTNKRPASRKIGWAKRDHRGSFYALIFRCGNNDALMASIVGRGSHPFFLFHPRSRFKSRLRIVIVPRIA